jgi:hypothetical protein
LGSAAEKVCKVPCKGDGSNITHYLCLACYLHVLDRYAGEFALSCSDYQISIGKDANDRDSQTEKSFDWSYSFVDSFFDVDFENVSCFCATVNVGISVIDGSTGEMSFDVAKVSVERLDFFVDRVDC